jgi:3-hydroxy acid dehydrogenase/malonic semialdehyde reductase
MSRVVLVTGATAGFGAEMSSRFLAAGDRVIGTGRRQDRLDELARAHPDHFLPLAFDITDRSATERAWESLPSPWREVDILVNNAGLALGIGRAWEADTDDWETMIATNCAALARLTRLVLPGMVQRRRGHVVNLGSIAAGQAYPGGNVYGASKAFVAQFSANLRADLAGTGVRVTLIEPGACETEFSLVRFKGDADKARQVYQGFQPMTAADIAGAVWWAVEQPQHVNVAKIELWATAQSPSGPTVTRGTS